MVFRTQSGDQQMTTLWPFCSGGLCLAPCAFKAHFPTALKLHFDCKADPMRLKRYPNDTVIRSFGTKYVLKTVMS